MSNSNIITISNSMRFTLPACLLLLLLSYCLSSTLSLSTLEAYHHHHHHEIEDHIFFRTGRFDTSLPGIVARFDWSAVTFGTHFVCDRVPITNDIHFDLRMDDRGNLYQAQLVDQDDDEVLQQQVLQTSTSTGAVYRISFNGIAAVLKPGRRYSLVVSKRTEAFFGTVKLYSLQMASNACRVVKETSKTAASKGLRIEFIGDSLSCGYGIEGESPCKFSAQTENALLAFPVITAQMLNAQEHSVLCYSGKGVVRNYGAPTRTSPDPLPVYYNRTLATIRDYIWDFKASSFQPDIVVITLGGNDFSTAPQPLYEEYAQGYHRLLDHVQRVNSPRKVTIFAVCGPLSHNCYGNFTQRVVQDRSDPLVHFVNLFGVFDPVDPGPHMGCAGHPNVEGNYLMAKRLSEVIQKVIG